MKKVKTIRLCIILIFVLGIIIYAAYLCLHFFFNKEYKKYLTGYTYEEGNTFTALEDTEPQIEEMVLAAESGSLKLYTNTVTTEIAIYDKRSGEITYSNPLDRMNDPIANGRNKVDLNSQFMLTYYDSSMTQITMYNYDYSVERKQFEIESIDNGIRYTYLLGNLDSPTGLVPPFITLERIQEKVLSKLTEKEAKNIRNNYIESKTLEGFLELTSGAQSNKIGLQKLNLLFEKAGYTQGDFDVDASLAAGGKLPERTTFMIPLEYRLLDDKLIVSIPMKQIKETGTGRLGNIDILSYLGAGTSEEDGYLLVPNGSGSLIYFNNGKKTERYIQYVYGLDEVSQNATVVEDTEKVRMPVYGIKHEKSVIFAEITDGDTLANIIANVSGDINSYNYVYPSFQIRGSEKVSMFGVDGEAADLPTLEKDIYNLNITISYSFLPEEESTYSGMANYYRKDLIDRGILHINTAEESIPFYLDIVGGVKQQQSILGIPYLSVYPMTTVKEAEEIIDNFYDEQITNLRINYLGWFNGGYYHDVAKNIKVERKLGGKKSLEKLNQKIEELGGKLYGDVAIQKVSFEAKHFHSNLESSQYYAGYVVSLGRINPVSLRQTSGLGYEETLYYVLSPRFLVSHMRDFVKEIKKINLSGVSMRDMGDMIASDKRRNNMINRQETKQIIMGQLKLLDEVVPNVMVSGGNAYSWAYASDIQNAPANHNPFYIVDEEIPFYQMVIHGCIDYTAGAINLSDSYDNQDIILHMIEFAVAPRFTLSYEDSSKIKYSGLNNLYSTQYEIWMEDAIDIYQKTNAVLKYVIGSTMLEHRDLHNGVKKISYDNGTVIYVNTTGVDIEAEGILVPAKGYLLEEVKE